MIRRAERADLPAIVGLLADDVLGHGRETISDPPAEEYVAAFDAISSDPNQLLAAMVEDSRVVGTVQLTFIPGLSRRGALRGQIEAVRIAGDRRGSGHGEALFKWAIDQCRQRGCAHRSAHHRQGAYRRPPLL